MKEQRLRIEYFLKGLPHLDLSETGLKNVCSRFGITLEELREKIEKLKGSIPHRNTSNTSKVIVRNRFKRGPGYTTGDRFTQKTKQP